jgi:uncharacterized protein (AIM24 family)
MYHIRRTIFSFYIEGEQIYMSEMFDVVESVQGATARFDILRYKPLQIASLYNAQKAGARLHQVRVTLENGSVITEAGALSFAKGNITPDNSIGGGKGAAGLFKNIASSMLTQESTFKPSYTGTGDVFLEPSFDHFLLYQLNNEEIIVDKGMFVACESSVTVGVAAQKSISAALKGGEGLFQTSLKGYGLVVLLSPVPAHEIMKLQLNNERLQVDGNFAILRSGNISFTVERSAKSIVGSMTSGEGYLQTFTGTGSVWVAPTYPIYHPPVTPSKI